MKTKITFLSIFTVVIIFLVGVVYFNPVSFYYVSGNSMSPTLKNTEAIVLLQKKIQKKQIVVFKKPKYWNITTQNNNIFIKRVMAVPGDTVAYQNHKFQVNGKTIFNVKKTQYLCPKEHEGFSVKVPKNRFLAFGDNYKVSEDSRRIFCTQNPMDAFIPLHNVQSNGKVIAHF